MLVDFAGGGFAMVSSPSHRRQWRLYPCQQSSLATVLHRVIPSKSDLFGRESLDRSIPKMPSRVSPRAYNKTLNRSMILI